MSDVTNGCCVITITISIRIFLALCSPLSWNHASLWPEIYFGRWSIKRKVHYIFHYDYIYRGSFFFSIASHHYQNQILVSGESMQLYLCLPNVLGITELINGNTRKKYTCVCPMPIVYCFLPMRMDISRLKSTIRVCQFSVSSHKDPPHSFSAPIDIFQIPLNSSKANILW